MNLNRVTVSLGQLNPVQIADLKTGKPTIKRGSCIENKIEINGILLSKNSVINLLNTEYGAKLKKGWFFGHIGSSPDSKVKKAFRKSFPLFICTFPPNMKEIANTPYVGTFHPKSTAKFFSAKLEKMLNEYNKTKGNIGYSRNYQPHIENLIVALKLYSESENLAQEFAQKDGHGMTGVPQPKTVGETFALALEDKSGTLFDAVKVLKKKSSLKTQNIPKELATLGKDVLVFLEDIEPRKVCGLELDQ